jgi:predicted phosphate transport protein (TIGR00153 family)
MVFSLRKRLFAKQKNIFYDLLYQQSEKTLEGLEALASYMDDPRPEKAKQVKKCEVEADDLRLILIQELDKTFVTPLDREDIFDLSRVIDDVMDYANSTVYEMEIYEVSADGHVKEMVNILMSAGREINHAIKLLEDQPKVAAVHAVKAKAYENTMEGAYRLALSHLFRGDDTVFMLKMREIYRHLSNAADRGDEAANIITSIVMKHS